MKDFKAHVDENPPAKLQELKQQVESLATSFPTVGFSEESMKYKQ